MRSPNESTRAKIARMAGQTASEKPTRRKLLAAGTMVAALFLLSAGAFVAYRDKFDSDGADDSVAWDAASSDPFAIEATRLDGSVVSVQIPGDASLSEILDAFRRDGVTPADDPLFIPLAIRKNLEGAGIDADCIFAGLLSADCKRAE